MGRRWPGRHTRQSEQPGTRRNAPAGTRRDGRKDTPAGTRRDGRADPRGGLRRGAAGVTAAAMVWLAAVCAGSEDIATAMEAVRGSAVVRELLAWELGTATGTLPLPVLAALGQSPQLLAAEGQVTRESLEGTLSSSPAGTETDNGAGTADGTEADSGTGSGSTGANTEAETGGGTEATGGRALSVTVSDETGYTRVGDVFVKNSSRQTLEGIVFDGSFAAKPGAEAPQVLILHTHGSEAYAGQANYRSTDGSVSVVRVGDELAKVLSAHGLSVVHDRTLYDDPQYNGAYYRAEDAIEAYLEKYPGISFILDVHRDALEDKAGHQYKVITREDPGCAQVSLVMGSSWEGWQENLKLAVAVQQHLTETHPTLMRPLTLRNSDYNEYFTSGSLLVEVGAAGNTLEEALAAARVFGEGLAEVIGGTTER